MFSTLPLFADAAEAPARENNFMQTLIMIGIALVFFYFILWRPEQKRRKAMEKQRSSLKKGDRVTAMGIVGTVFKVQDATVILKMVDGAKIEVLKGAITDVQAGTEEEESKRVELNPNDSDR
ncbi:MAG: preprotein translocase subunit YajC [Chlamydiales bacterium]|nr:preprotein translocase subunit YajC [Chlamydiales bacterium]